MMESRPARKTKTATPLPGVAVRGSRSGRPIMALFDLLGRRWSLRILWELRDGAALGFRELQRVAGDLSPSLLNTRLHELREAGILESTPNGYALTPIGRDLLAALGELDQWARSWSNGLRGRTR